MSIDEKFETILKSVLQLPEFDFADEMQAKNIPGWNSLSHLMVIVALEDGFNIRFSAAEALQAKNLKELKETIQRKLL
ncbi:MAG: acyl carrier protein [Proteobacteria bacterium]|nr:MAG: acyl carrier protein [Pseudomonadota bacterium]